MKNLTHFNNDRLFKAAFLSLILIKLILVMGHRMHPLALFLPHDDGLMYNMAVSITNGKWLGAYNQLTLAKGVFFPIWLAFLNLLSLPMLVGNQILYTASCLFFIWCIKPIIKNKKILVLTFTVLLFNPLTLGIPNLLRVYRDGIFPSLIIFVFAGIIGMFLYRDNDKKMLICSSLYGIGLSAAWHTREDTFWVLPFVIIANIVIAIFIFIDKKCMNRIKKSICLILPLIMLIISNLSVSTLNYIAYGRFVRNDYMSRDFQGAFGALARVAHERFDYFNPVPEEVRMKIYQMSPAFNELRPFLDEGPLEGWKEHGKIQFGWSQHDFYSWFMWALRDAVACAGYYENPQKAKEYYIRLAKEINDAIDRGLLPGRSGKRSTLATPYSKEYFWSTVNNVIAAAKFVIKYDNVVLHITPMFIPVDQSQRLREMELYLNQFSTGVVREVELSGWAFDDSENVNIRVTDITNQDIDAMIIKR